MKKVRIEINHIPALVWGEKSDKVYLCVHGKMSSKESAEGIARIVGKDDLQSLEIIKNFTNKHNCRLTVSENSEHPFMAEGDGVIVEQWLEDNI